MVSPRSPRALPLAKATEQRARLAAAQAELAELKAAKLRGTLLDATDVEAEWSSLLRAVRAAMLAVPSRLAQRLPHLTTHDLVEVEAELHAALKGLGNP